MKRATRDSRWIRRRARRGVTLVEVAISAAILVVFIGAGLGTLLGAQSTYTRGAMQTALHSEATRIADRLVAEIAPCGASTLSVIPVDAAGNGPYLVMQECIGYTAAGKKWGAPFLIGFEPNPSTAPLPNLASALPGPGGGVLADLDDAPPPSMSLAAIDNVSTASVVLIEGPDKTILGANLAPKGLQIAVQGSVISFRVELERPIAGKAPVRAHAIRAVRLAN